MYNKQLFGLEKNGDVKVWNIRVVDTFHDHPEYEIIISHGKLNGKLTFKTELVSKGKQGRSVYDQAVLQAEARTKKQVDKGYRETVEELTDLPLLAMLAEDYNKKGHLIKFPCYTSVKYDGVRCLIHKRNGATILESRTGQEFNVPHIAEHIGHTLWEGETVDGELYLHGYELQDILSAVKRTDPDAEIEKARKHMAKNGEEFRRPPKKGVEQPTALEELNDAIRIKYIRENLEFHLFDIPVEGRTFQERLGFMDEMFTNNHHVPYLKFAMYQLCENDAQLKCQHAQAVKDGFEGVMLRNIQGVYESGKRSSDLQKYKTFMDAEFLILDVLPDNEDGARFLLQNNVNDLSFTCVMGTMQERAYQLANKHEFIDKWLNVKFQTRYKRTLLPQFPTGQYIRDGYAVGREFVPYD